MSSFGRSVRKPKSSKSRPADPGLMDIAEAEAVLVDLARVFADPALNPLSLLQHFTSNGTVPVADDARAKP